MADAPGCNGKHESCWSTRRGFLSQLRIQSTALVPFIRLTDNCCSTLKWQMLTRYICLPYLTLIASISAAGSGFPSRVSTLRHKPRCVWPRSAGRASPQMSPLTVAAGCHRTTHDNSGVTHVLYLPGLRSDNQRRGFGGEAAHFSLVSSLSRCHGSPPGRQGAGGAYVGEADGVDSDPFPSMLSGGGWQTCTQLEEWIMIPCWQRVVTGTCRDKHRGYFSAITSWMNPEWVSLVFYWQKASFERFTGQKGPRDISKWRL